MKVGVLGGSFDPIHLGHLNLAISLQEACNLDKVLFCPSALSPFKVDHPPKASIQDRLALLQLAIQPVPSFSLIDWEAKQEGPSYTIDTILRLSQDPSLQLHLLIGEDHLPQFAKWKDSEKLIQLAPPLVATRATPHSSPSSFESHVFQKIAIPLYDISSTRIRERLSKKQCCIHLLPAPVLDYILEHEIY